MLDQRMTQIASQVAKMTPQQRQKFAMLHKSDPIIVSLTKFVNDQEKALRASMQAQAAPAQQPPVVDQTIAEMAPAPAQGLGQAPAPSLADIPDGGIVGYADGGAVDVYPHGDFGLPRLLKNVDVGEAVRKFGDKAKRVLLAPIPGTAPPAAPPEGRPTMKNDPRQIGPVLSPMQAEREANMAQVNAPPAPPAAPAMPPEEDDPVRKELLRLALGGSESGAGGGGGGGAPAAGGGIASLPQAPTAPNIPAPIDVAGAMREQMANLPTLPPEIAQRLDAVAAARAGVADERLAQTQQRHEEMGIAGADRERRLKEREGKLAKSENDNTGLALLSAGLAMMSGTSPNAFANIGAGAQVGLQQYQEGKARLDAARERLDDQFSTLEELRRNERNMNAKELAEAKLGIKQAALETSQEAASAVANMYGVNQQTAVKMVDSMIRQAGTYVEAQTRVYGAQLQADTQLRTTAMDTASRENVARIGARASGRSAKMAALGMLVKPGREEKLNDLYLRATDIARKSMADDPTLLLRMPEGSAAYSQELKKRTDEIVANLPNQQGMPQSRGAPSSAGQPTLRFNPQTGNVEPYR